MKKPLDTAIVKNCTFLTSIQHVHIIGTHSPEIKCLVVTFSDGFQVEYLFPTEGEHYLVMEEMHTNTTCVILYPECKPTTLTFTTQE